MKRSIFALAAAAMVLGGCSSKKEGPDKPSAAAPKQAKKGKKAAPTQPHTNPWAKEAPADAAQAEAPAKPAKKGGNKSAPAASHENPWAKDQPAPESPA